MGQVAHELIVALVAVALITGGYLILAQEEIPQPNSVAGYALGVTGFLLMVSTETLYSLRKRLMGFHLGPMSTWLQVHVITGLIGPLLVLLHSGWRFNGLAGVLTLVVGLVVVSGLVGRYVYTAVPRNVEGAALAIFELEEQIVGLDRQLHELGMEEAALALAEDLPQKGWVIVLARPFLRRRQQRQIRQAIHKLDANGQSKAVEMTKLLTERQRLLGSMRSLEATRRLLALWHFFHVPLSFGLFALAFMHIGAALYYAAFTR